jgi:hypothetical protein
MSLQIDPNSVRLGKNALGVVDNIYDARYVGATGATGSCVLPPEIPYTPGNYSLIPLQPSCTFNFTDVLEIPPIPAPPPPASFRGCETLSASTSIITTNATKNTSLSLVAGGPFPGETGTNDCTLKLVGVIDVDACTNFTATSAVTFNNAAAGSSLTITAASIPNCGFDLRGNINIAACETFSATSNINFGNALKGSYLTLTPSSLPNCGLDISGNLDITACETFNASSAVSFRGNAVKKSSFSVSPTSAPNCGFTLNGDVIIDACTDFSASGGINFSGKAVKSSSVTVTAAQQPNCGLVLSGNVEIDACATFTAVNNLQIYGQAVSTIRPISITYASTPDCGFTLNGELSIDACASVGVDIVPDNTNPSFITLYTDVPEGQTPDKGEIFSSARIILRSTPLIQDGCNTVVGLSMDSIDLALPSSCCPIIAPYTPTTLTGCCWDEDANGPRLYKDDYTNELYVGGALPIPCFVCDTTITAPGTMPFVFSDITINSLAVNYIGSTNCCRANTDGMVDVCNAVIRLTNASTLEQSYQTPTGMTLQAGWGGVTQINAADVYLADVYRRVELETGGLTIADISASDNDYLYATASSLYITDQYNNNALLTSNYFKVSAYGGDTAKFGIIDELNYRAGYYTLTGAGDYSFLTGTDLKFKLGGGSPDYLYCHPLSLEVIQTANLFSKMTSGQVTVKNGSDESKMTATEITTKKITTGTSSLDTSTLTVAGGANLTGTKLTIGTSSLDTSTLTVGTNSTLTASQLTVGGTSGGRLNSTTLNLGSAYLNSSGMLYFSSICNFNFGNLNPGSLFLKAVNVCVGTTNKTVYVFANW